MADTRVLANTLRAGDHFRSPTNSQIIYAVVRVSHGINGVVHVHHMQVGTDDKGRMMLSADLLIDVVFKNPLTQSEMNDAVDAARWRALMGSQRMRLLSLPIYDGAGAKAISMEFIAEDTTPFEASEHSRKALTQYVDASIKESSK